MDLTPTWEAPIAMQMAAISSSVCLVTTPNWLAWAEIHSMMDVAGVMG